MNLPPSLPQDLLAPCQDCAAARGELCRKGCPSGYSADDYRADSARHDKENQ